jgi:hypothetical protein
VWYFEDIRRKLLIYIWLNQAYLPVEDEGVRDVEAI